MEAMLSSSTILYRLPVPQPRLLTSTSALHTNTWLATSPSGNLFLHYRNRRKLGLPIRTSSVRNLAITCGVTEIGASQFADVVLKSDRPVLVEFVANWCGPCRLMASTINAIAEEDSFTLYEYHLRISKRYAEFSEGEYKEKMTVVKIDHDANPELIEEFKVYGLPTLILFKNGKEVAESRREGAISAVKLKNYVDSMLDSVSVS